MKLRKQFGLLAAACLVGLLLLWAPWRDRRKEAHELYLSLCGKYDSEVTVGMHQEEVTRRFGQPISTCRAAVIDANTAAGTPARTNPPYPNGVVIVGWKIHEDYTFDLEISDGGYVTRKYSGIHEIHRRPKSLFERLRSLL